MVEKTDIREYAENYEVNIRKNKFTNNRLAIESFNEGHCNCTWVDLIDVIDWVKANMPELLNDN